VTRIVLLCVSPAAFKPRNFNYFPLWECSTWSIRRYFSGDWAIRLRFPLVRGVGSKLKCPVFVAREMSGHRLISRRRSCGKVGIPRWVRDFQARRESRVFDFSAGRLCHSSTRADFVVLQ